MFCFISQKVAWSTTFFDHRKCFPTSPRRICVPMNVLCIQASRLHSTHFVTDCIWPTQKDSLPRESISQRILHIHWTHFYGTLCKGQLLRWLFNDYHPMIIVEHYFCFSWGSISHRTAAIWIIHNYRTAGKVVGERGSNNLSRQRLFGDVKCFFLPTASWLHHFQSWMMK